MEKDRTTDDGPVPTAAALPAPPPSPMPASTPAGRRVGFIVAVVVVAVLLVSGVAVAAVMFALRGSGEQLTGKVPGNVDVFATAYLDPSAGQKVNLVRMLHRFPALGSEQQLRGRLDDAMNGVLGSTGLSYQDVQPWLGSQVGVAARMDDSGTSLAFLLDSTDDAAARAALGKLRSEGQLDGASYTWKGVEQAGSTIWVGTPEFGGQPIAATIETGTVVVGNSERLVSEVIATAHGDVPSLAESGDFRATTESLPEDRLGIAYVNVGSLVSRLGELGGAAGTSFAGPNLTGVDPSVLKGLAVAVRARPDGLELDTTGTLDPTKLTPEMRTALEADGDPSAVLSEVPSDAYGVIAVTGLKEQIDAALARFGGTGAPALAQLGLTGPDGVLEHLTGSAAIEAEPGTGRYPTGAIVIGTDDPVGMQSFLDNLSVIAAQSFAAPQFGAGFGGAGKGSNSQSLIETDALESAPASWSRSTYHGVSISSIQIPGDVGIEPAYAVVNDAGIVAASPEAVRAVIDAHEGGGLSSEGDFKAALAAVGGMDESLVYVNVADVASAVREALPPDERAQFDRDIAPNLAPLKAFVTGGESDSSGSRQRTVLLVR